MKKHNSYKIGVIGGAGYVGLVTSVGLASLGHNVLSQDLNLNRINLLKKGKSEVYEEGLENILSDLIFQKFINFTDNIEETIRHSDVVFVAVGTPSLSDGRADMSQIISVAEKLRDLIDHYTIVVVKSTVPVGAIEVIQDILSEKLSIGEDFDVVSNPEFLREGSGLIDFYNPSRIIIGCNSEFSGSVLREIYKPLLDREFKVRNPFSNKNQIIEILLTDPVSAQMVKYASNAFLATRISFINEIAGISEKVGGNISDIIYGIGLDPRIGSDYLKPGIGFGGPCLDKDLRALITLSEENYFDSVMLNGVLRRNDLQLQEVINKINIVLGSSLYKHRISILGLAFKEGTNDVRHSLSIRLAKFLIEQGAIVTGHDILATNEAALMEDKLIVSENLNDVLNQAEIVIILNSEKIYSEINWSNISPKTYVIDTRGIVNISELEKHSIKYDVLGTK
ncbi:MAG: UDP-glucose 6-dehydrogenase [Chloroflexi bacterium]|nr:UDP-glucose 6-dehydrogenase [Chloroflexota bacterium]MBL01240.1 UDP-glucose 6-dehydrogenase [Chloroflexota bacterium]